MEHRTKNVAVTYVIPFGYGYARYADVEVIL